MQSVLPNSRLGDSAEESNWLQPKNQINLPANIQGQAYFHFPHLAEKEDLQVKFWHFKVIKHHDFPTFAGKHLLLQACFT